MTRGSFSCDLSQIYFGWRSARGFQNSTFLCSNNLMSWGSFFVRLGSDLLGLEVCQGGMGPDKVASISWQARDIWTPFSCWNEIKYFLCQLRIRKLIVFEDNCAASETTNLTMCSVLVVSLLLFQCWLLATFVVAWNTSRIKHKNISDFFKSTAGVGRRGIRCWLNWRSGCNPNAICSTQFQFSIQANCCNAL